MKGNQMIELNASHPFYGIKFVYVLLDFDNNPIRFFKFPKKNTIKLKVKPFDPFTMPDALL